MNLTSILQDRAREHPDRIALVETKRDKDRTLTYAELAARMARGAGQLESMGLGKGKHILVFHPVSLELYELLLAVFHVGARAMLLDPGAGRPFLEKCCARLAPDGFFGSWKAHLYRCAVPSLRRIPHPLRSGFWFPGVTKWRPEVVNSAPPVTDVADEEPALITFTSGSTGQPKAAVRTHGFLMAQQRTLAGALDFVEGEVDLITLPVFTLANLASGLTSVIAATNLARPGAPDTRAVSLQCARWKPTRCAASPAFFDAFFHPNSAAELPRLSKVFTGGAPVYPDLLRRLETALPEAVVEAVYGSTEAEPIAHTVLHEKDARITQTSGGLCAGPPVPAIRLKIIADQWGHPLAPASESEWLAMERPRGEAGEIVVSGDHVLPGYLDGQGNEETKIFAECRIWHRTGDAGRLDEQGRIWLLGRCQEKLPGGGPDGGPLYPFAIECALRETFPGQRFGALVFENRRTLVVEGDFPTAELGLFRQAAEKLGMEMLVALPSIPLDRRHNAKIDYPALRAALEKARERQEVR